MLIIADHASAHVPADIDLGIDPALLDEHIAVDIGIAPLAAALADRTGCAAILAGVSRLVIDLNREIDHPGLIPVESDGHAIPGNVGIAPEGRIARFHAPWHAAIAAAIAEHTPGLLISLHSFTPRLRSTPAPRPWEVGVLYNRDDRAARLALPLLTGAGIVAGDNEPYSGRLLNATMNRHGEANGIAYLGLEVRNDLITDPAGVARWADRLALIVLAVRSGLARHGGSAT